jgi:hypothetical protein
MPLKEKNLQGIHSMLIKSLLRHPIVSANRRPGSRLSAISLANLAGPVPCPPLGLSASTAS